MTREHEQVAVTGVGVICALGTGTDAVWKAACVGDTGIGRTTRLDTSTLSCQYSGEVADVPLPSRRPVGRLDRAMRMALVSATEAVESAALDLELVDPYRVGVALGTSVGGLDSGERYHWQLLRGGVAAASRGHLLVYPLYTSADAVSTTFGLRGPKVVVSNACAAGANSIGYAADAIREGRADVMLAGGVDVLDILSLAGFDSLKALDPEPCAPYSRSSGLNIGEGAAVLVLESRSLAERRGAPVLSYVRGYALSSDAHHATAPDPAGDGAYRAMRAALDTAGLEPTDVDYVNGHGTGTPANDSAEAKAFKALFGDEGPPTSSSKSQLGHMLGNAGAGEAALCVLALRDQLLPPTVNVDPDVEVTRDIVPGKSRQHGVDVVVSNSFAFGGNNCALVFAREPGGRTQVRRRRVVVTGTGVVSSLGMGQQEFVDTLRAGGRAGTDAEGSTPASVDACRRLVDPRYARRLDQLGLFVLAASRMAATAAGLRLTRETALRTGMIFGTFTGPLETVAKLTETIGTAGPERVNPRLFPNSVMNAAAGHACLSLNIKGPLSTLATGTASGLVGLGYATDVVRRGDADVMLAVGADELTSLLRLGYDHLGLLSPDGTRPYERDASGFALGSGSAALVVESLDHALGRGAPILAEVHGHGMASDAYRVAGNDPSGDATAASYGAALADAGSGAGDVGVVYGDARGTAAIDGAEARAIASLWPPGSVAVANLGSRLGHVHSTSPLLSAVSAVETCRTGWLPDLGEVADPLPDLADHLAEQPDPTGRLALVTATNWGGTYASVVLGPWSG